MVHLLSLKFGPNKVQSDPFLEHLPKIHSDLFIPRYSDSPQVSCLWMNFGREWNPNLKGSYLLEYRKYEVEFWAQCKSGFDLRPVKVSSPDPFPILIYSESTKTYQF